MCKKDFRHPVCIFKKNNFFAQNYFDESTKFWSNIFLYVSELVLVCVEVYHVYVT